MRALLLGLFLALSVPAQTAVCQGYCAPVPCHNAGGCTIGCMCVSPSPGEPGYCAKLW